MSCGMGEIGERGKKIVEIFKRALRTDVAEIKDDIMYRYVQKIQNVDKMRSLMENYQNKLRLN